MIATRALAISLIGLLLTACSDIFPKSVTLHNRSAELLSGISIDFAGDVKRVARLSPGQFVGLASAKGVTFTREGVTRSLYNGPYTEQLPDGGGRPQRGGRLQWRPTEKPGADRCQLVWNGFSKSSALAVLLR